MKRALALLLFLPWGSISAQTCRPGELRVFVLDSQQAPISDALVRIGSDSAPLAEGSTHTLGSADFENVPCGAWNVAASKDGFEAASATAQVTAGASAEITLTLNPKAQRTSVDVKETPPPIETTATPKQELRPADVKPLPTNPATYPASFAPPMASRKWMASASIAARRS